MRHAIATVCLSGLLQDQLQAAAAARFDGVEIFENDLLQYPGSAADVRRMAQDLGLAIDLFQPFRDFDAATPAQLARNLERARRKFALMHALGTDMVLVCSSVQPDASGDPALLAEQFAQLAELAGRNGMRVAYEALSWGSKSSCCSAAAATRATARRTRRCGWRPWPCGAPAPWPTDITIPRLPPKPNQTHGTPLPCLTATPSSATPSATPSRP